MSDDEQYLLTAIKTVAVTPVAVSVRRSELLSMKQDHTENTRSLFARINSKATTCAYAVDCTSDTCQQKIYFTDIIVKDVLISGLADDNITFLEAKEMARDALSKQSVRAVSTYKREVNIPGSKEMMKCKRCKINTAKFVYSKRQQQMIECTLNANSSCSSKNSKPGENVDETNAILHVVGDRDSTILVGGAEMLSFVKGRKNMHSKDLMNSSVVLDHHIFDSSEG